jgi:O-antigen ligase
MAYIRLNMGKVFNLLCILVISWLILGLYISFSRTALVALVFSLSVIIFGYFWLNSGQKQQKKPLLALSIYSIGWVVVLGLLFWPITQARQPHLKEAAIAERANYNSIGLAMFKDHFWFGVGLNQSIVHMQEYSKVPLKPWEHQPVHNYFILLAAELGVFPLIVILAFLLQVFWLVLKKAIKRNLSVVELLTFAFLCGLLGLMNGDHYFYTLRVGQIFFWLSVAVVGRVFFDKSK